MNYAYVLLILRYEIYIYIFVVRLYFYISVYVFSIILSIMHLLYYENHIDMITDV